jgi:hypothetical protein
MVVFTKVLYAILTKRQEYFNQGILIEGEASVQLSSSLNLFCKKGK